MSVILGVFVEIPWGQEELAREDTLTFSQTGSINVKWGIFAISMIPRLHYACHTRLRPSPR